MNYTIYTCSQNNNELNYQLQICINYLKNNDINHISILSDNCSTSRDPTKRKELSKFLRNSSSNDILVITGIKYLTISSNVFLELTNNKCFFLFVSENLCTKDKYNKYLISMILLSINYMLENDTSNDHIFRISQKDKNSYNTDFESDIITNISNFDDEKEDGYIYLIKSLRSIGMTNNPIDIHVKYKDILGKTTQIYFFSCVKYEKCKSNLTAWIIGQKYVDIDESDDILTDDVYIEPVLSEMKRLSKGKDPIITSLGDIPKKFSDKK